VAPSADTSPGTLAEKCPGGQATMAQFLQVPAKDKFVSVAGFVQSRNHGFGKWTISSCFTMTLSKWRAKIVTSLLPQPSVLWARPYLFVSLPDYCLVLRIFLFVFVLLGNFSCGGALGKNYNILSSILQALCQSFERSIGQWGFGNVLANLVGIHNFGFEAKNSFTPFLPVIITIAKVNP
jgi:hypothetical protein